MIREGIIKKKEIKHVFSFSCGPNKVIIRRSSCTRYSGKSKGFLTHSACVRVICHCCYPTLISGDTSMNTASQCSCASDTIADDTNRHPLPTCCEHYERSTGNTLTRIYKKD